MTIKLKILVPSPSNLDAPGTMVPKTVEIRIDSFENFKEDWTRAHYPQIFERQQIIEIYHSLPK